MPGPCRDLVPGPASGGDTGACGVAQTVRTETLQACLVAAVAKPVAEACRRERLASFGHEKCQMPGRRRVERGLDFGEDRKLQLDAGLAAQYGDPDAESTFNTPFVPRLNKFYGRNLHYKYDAARSQQGILDAGRVAIITEISTQRLEISAFSVFDWMKEFFALCQMEIARSEAGLRCGRLIAQMGGLQDCRVLKIRGVRNLLRKYSVDEHFTRSGAMECIRDIDKATGALGFDAFKRLHIEYRRGNELKADDVLRYLLERRVFRVGLDLTCPNCRLPSWIHLDDVSTRSNCTYCDHEYDVTPQLRDRDWRYRRSGIFGRDDNQLGGIPVALTMQHLSTSLRQDLLMYSTAMNFLPVGAAIEPCRVRFCSGGRGHAREVAGADSVRRSQNRRTD